MRTYYAYLATDQQTRPLGIRVVEPPADTLQSARGRLYAVIEYADSTPETTQRVERALSTIQRTYYTIKGTQSYVLGEALREALQQLTAETQTPEQNADLGILLVALLENRLLAVGIGAVIALFTHGGKVDVFPPGAIGFTETGEPTFDVYRQDAPVGTAFLLAGNYCLEYFSLRDLAGTVAHINHENLATVTSALCQHASVAQLPGLFVVTRSDEAPTGANPEGKGATPSSTPPRRRFGGLPAALQTPPPARQGTGPSAGGSPALAERGPAGAYGRDGEALTAPDRHDVRTGEEGVPALTADQPAPRVPFQWSALLDQGVTQTKAFLAKILPERVPPGAQTPLATPMAEQTTSTYQSAKVAPATAPFPDLDLDLEQPYATPAQTAGAPRSTTLLDRLAAFRPPARAKGGRARLFILLALLILILTPVVVTGVYWSRDKSNQQEAERTLDMAEASFLAAEGALEDGDKATARVKLIDAQTFILAADNLMGGRLVRADELSVRIEREMADLLQVQPLYALAAPLVQFLPDALPKRVVVSDQDVYVLDVGRQVVQYFQLDPTRTMVTNVEGEVVLEKGATVDNTAVGELVDITWQPPIAGVQDKAYLLVLDRNNNLFRYDRRVEGASRLALGGPGQLNRPVRMKVYADRLYIADEGAGQLFRYSGNYTQPPVSWFNAQAQSDLSSLRAFEIDGDIWMLYAQGMVSRYRSGEQVPFSLDNSVGAIVAPVDIAVGDQGNSMVYIADSDQERILVYDKEGVYQRQLRAPEGHPLRDLQAIYVDEIENTIYLLTQTSLFKHPLTQAN